VAGSVATTAHLLALDDISTKRDGAELEDQQSHAKYNRASGGKKHSLFSKLGPIHHSTHDKLRERF
jgi:hypothetical protein